ncbi:2'-5'-oligoadenylate synthase 3-like isoform X2 [Equus quagga]|uniref:2'-5'-oligoadenylate synthase 3-like isoform X2 n=1 Tax=Equus quagga TaxID=89248 RepID=UPI001EE1D1EF|nr:2'-5'-oligoadenylate synthase 3-like isoform X2 [Equus quagga]
MLAVESYHCERCGSDFVSCMALKYHFRRRHLGKVHCENCGQEVLREKLQDHSKSVHDRSTMETHKLNWENLEERNIKHKATKISKTCRMCSRCFGTVLSRENHEIQEHHFTASKRAQMSAGFSLHNMLECKSPQELQRFADEKIHPASGPLRAACVAEIAVLVQRIQDCFPVRDPRVIQAGSYIKGTDTRGCSEIDIVLFSDVFANANHCKKQLREGLDALRKNLKQTSYGNRILMGKRAPLSLRFNFLCTGSLHSHSFEIMAYYDVLGPTPSAGTTLYSVSRFRRLPSSYTMELLTIYVWELAGKPLLFSLVQGLRAVLKLLVQYTEIDIVWHRHYHRKFPVFVKVNQKHTRPFILDPVNPTVNVCDTCNAWDEVAHVARCSLLKPLFSRVRAEPPWLFTNNW